MDYSSEQNQYPYPPASQPYNPSRYQPYYQHHPHQQKQPQQQPLYHQQQHQQQVYHQQQQQYQQPQQQYSSYYTPNYPNPYPAQHPQTHQQWHHQEPPIHPPGVSSQPYPASHGQTHFQLPNQQNAYHLPQRTDGVGLGMNPGGVAAVAALAQLNQLAGSVGAAERRTGGSHGQSWYSQAQGLGPVIGGPGTYTAPGMGSGALPGHRPGPSRLRSRAGRSLDKGGDRRRRVGGPSKGDQSKGRQSKGRGRGGKIKVSKPAGVGRCDVCNIDCGCLGILKVHLSGKRHKRNLEKLEANENRTVSDTQNVQKPSGDLEPETDTKSDNLLVEEETKQNPPQNIPLDTVTSENNLLVEEETKQNPPQDIPLDTVSSENNLLVEEETKQNPPQNIPLDTVSSENNLLVEEETKQNPPQNIPLDTVSSENNLLVEEEAKQNQPENIPLDTVSSENNLLVEEEAKQNQPENIPLDTASSENKLETEQKINNAEQADPPTDANQDLLEKKPMVNESGNQNCGVKRKTLGDGRKIKKNSKAKRQVIGSSKPLAVPLMCDLCNVECGTREILRQHLLGRKHKLQLKCSEDHHPKCERLGLQALYPPNPVTESANHSQGAQQVLNDAQVSDPIAGASLLPQNDNAPQDDNAAPSATCVVSD